MVQKKTHTHNNQTDISSNYMKLYHTHNSYLKNYNITYVNQNE